MLDHRQDQFTEPGRILAKIQRITIGFDEHERSRQRGAFVPLLESMVLSDTHQEMQTQPDDVPFMFWGL